MAVIKKVKKLVTVTARVTPDIKKRIEAYAKGSDRDESYVIRTVLTNYFAQRGK